MASTSPTLTPTPTPTPIKDDYSLHFFVIASVLVGLFSLIAYYAYQRYKQMISHDPTTPKLLSDDEGHDVEMNEKNDESGIFQHASPSSQPPYTPDQNIISPSDREYEYDHSYQHEDGDQYHDEHYDDDGMACGGGGGEGEEGGEGAYTYDQSGEGMEGNANYEEGHATELDTFDILACDGIENNDAPDGLDESGFADVYTGVEETEGLEGDPSGGVYLDMEGADGGLLAGEEIVEPGDVTGQEFDEIGLDGPDQAPESTLDESYVMPDDVTEHHFEMDGDSYYDDGDDVPLTTE